MQRSFAGRFLAGISYMFRGLSLVFGNRRIFLLAIGPFLVTLVMYVGVAVAAILLADDLADLIIGPGAWWRTLIRWTLMVSLPIITLVLLVFTYSLLSLLIGAPFFEFLSAAVEERVTGEVKEEPFGFRAFLVDMGRALADSVKFVLIEFLILALGLVFVPVSTVMCVLLSAVLMALEVMDAPMGRRRMVFRERVRYARRNFWVLLGFGLAVLGGLVIPFVGILLLPAGVAGGTALFCSIEAGGRPE